MQNMIGLVSIYLAQQGLPIVAPQSTGESGGHLQRIIDGISTYLAQYGLQIVGAILLLVIGRWVAKVLSVLVGKSLSAVKMDPMLVSFVQSLVYAGLLVFVVVAALANLGVETTSLIAVLGAAGLAVGLALQGSLANFAAGVLLLVFKPFKVGDFIEAAGAKGTVREIQIFSTILDTLDNVRVIVPNNQITSGNIMNHTGNGIRRVDMVFSISYGDDIEKAHLVIGNVLATDERVLPDPPAAIVLGQLGSSSVDLFVRPWIKAVKMSDYWQVQYDMNAKIKHALEAAGLTIPFSQHDVHIKGGELLGALKK